MSPREYVTDSLVVFRLKPNMRGHLRNPGVMDYWWTANSQSLRATREYALTKPSGTRRILTLGDSFTFGAGVDDAQSWPARLEQELDSACGAPVEVLNGGTSGYSTSQEVESFERYGRAFQPDVVLLGVTFNDFDDNLLYPVHTLVGDSVVPRPIADRPSWGTAKRVTEMIPGYEWLIEHSALMNGIRQAYFRAQRRAAVKRGSTPRAASKAGLDNTSVRLMRALLRRMKREVEATGATLTLVLMPDMKSAKRYIAGERERALEITAMRGLCAELSLYCIDVAEAIASVYPMDRIQSLYIVGDGHFTVAGNEAVVNAVVPRMRELVCAR